MLEKKIDEWIDSQSKKIVEDTSKLVQIKSVRETPEPGMPFGQGPYEALKWVLDKSEALGLTAQWMDGYAVFASYGEGDQTIGVLSHVDVVPEGSGWQFPPYGGLVIENKIYGRGAMDDKGPLVASLYALAAIKSQGIKLDKTVRLLFGADEETGMESIKHYLSKEKPFDLGFTPDARFPVIHGEKGWLNLSLHLQEKQLLEAVGPVGAITADLRLASIKGGVAANVVADQCEAILTGSQAALSYAYDGLIYFINKTHEKMAIKQTKNSLEISTYGKAAHASRPEKGRSAISIMLCALGYVLPKDTQVGAFANYFAHAVGMGFNGEGCGCGFEDEKSGKLTFNIGQIRYEEGALSLLVDVRYPVSFSEQDVKNGVKQVFTPFGIDTVLLDFEPPLYYDLEHPLVQTLSSCYQKVSGDYESKPMVVGGLTYARTMPNVVAYGPMGPNARDIAHQKDEYIDVETLIEATKIYARAILKLASL